MAETQMSHPWGSTELQLYPPDPNSTLRAWDAADEFILQSLHEQEQKRQGPVLLVNDTYGALHCALRDQECHHLNDSYSSRQAIKANLKLNKQQSKLQDAEASSYQVVLIKIPKTLSLLEYQLYRLSSLIDENTLIIGGAMTRLIHNSTLSLFEQWIGPVKTSLARKKARLIFSQWEEHALPDYQLEESYSIPEIPEPLVNLPNLFSRDHLDKGTALFLESMHPLNDEETRIVDFGSGNGVIAIYAALQNPHIQVDAIEDSQLAVESSRINVQHNGLEKRISIHHQSGLNELEGGYHRIFSNPPFHQGLKIDLKPTLNFFEAALEKLEPQGELRIVCNRHLGYHKHLEKIFGNCKTIREKEGYLILIARKN